MSVFTPSLCFTHIQNVTYVNTRTHTHTPLSQFVPARAQIHTVPPRCFSPHLSPLSTLLALALCGFPRRTVTFSVSRHQSVCLCDCVLTHRLWRSVFFSGSKAWIMFYFQLVIMAGTVLLAYYFEYTDTFPVHVQGFFCFDKTFSKPYPGPDETSNVPPVLVYSLVAAIPTLTVSSPSFLCVLVGIVRLNFSLGDKLSSFIIWIYVHVM